jgi:hypothetical protein
MKSLRSTAQTQPLQCDVSQCIVSHLLTARQLCERHPWMEGLQRGSDERRSTAVRSVIELFDFGHEDVHRAGRMSGAVGGFRAATRRVVGEGAAWTLLAVWRGLRRGQ